jgi:hypothetical protein
MVKRKNSLFIEMGLIIFLASIGLACQLGAIPGPSNSIPGLTPAVPATAMNLDNEARVKNWPLVFKDSFDDNRNGWHIEQINGSAGKADLNITMGKYHWEEDPLDGFNLSVTLTDRIFSNFILAGDVQLAEDRQFYAGLVFRAKDDNNKYLFQISGQYYNLLIESSGKWSLLAGPIFSNAIRPGQTNHLGVMAVDKSITLTINDIFVVRQASLAFLPG